MKKGGERKITALDLVFCKGHVKKEMSALPHTSAKDSFAKISHWWKKHRIELFSWVFLFSAEFCTISEPSRLSLAWCCAPRLATGSNKSSREQGTVASLRLHRYAQTGIIWDALDWEISVLAYLLFIRGKCHWNKIYTLDCADKIVSEPGLVTLISTLKLNILMKTSLDFCGTK